MSVMTAQLPIPVPVTAGAVPIGMAAALVEDADGGRVFLHGQLVYAWDANDAVTRRFAAAQLAGMKAAQVIDIAAAFSVEPATVWRWRKQVESGGVAALVADKSGPKGPHRVTQEMVEQMFRLRRDGKSLRTIGATVGVSEFSVRRALASHVGEDKNPGRQFLPETAEAAQGADPLPVLPAPVDRSGDRAAARAGLLEAAEPVFAPAARVPLAGLFFALPALEATGLLTCSKDTFGSLPDGFYGLESMLLESVFRTLAGEPRAEGAGRIEPVALGRILGLDRAPEVKTIRRKIGALAATAKAAELLKSIASRQLNRGAGNGEPNQDLAAVLYVDGHVRAYQGTRKIAKTHSTRLKFPAPATAETWVCDANGDPVFVIMSEPGAALTGELRRLLPQLRSIIGDDRPVLVGFDRGGWSPALFAQMAAKGFDVLTWRKGITDDVDAELFTNVSHTDEHGASCAWDAAETMVELPIDDQGEVFTMRQISRRIQGTAKKPGRQIHILTTRTDLPAGEIIYRMGSRWRQENYFRYARMHFDLDSHDSYATSDDDPERMVPNPAKKTAHQIVAAARARYEKASARTDAALLSARTPTAGSDEILITNTTHDAITAQVRGAQADLQDAKDAHRQIPARTRLGDIAPGQQVLETETKLLTHAIRMAAFNTATALARDIRINTGYARADDEAHTLIRQVLTASGDIDPTADGRLTIRLDPMPTGRATAAVAELCEHLTATQTRYPGTDRTLRYEIKNQPSS